MRTRSRSWSSGTERMCSAFAGACCQQQDAEDVCQCTFLLLARKAGCITWRGCVRGWLHAAACRLALNVRTTALRRRLKPPIESPYSRSDPLAEIVQQEVRRLLDDELHGLPEKYRAPVVLCYLEGKTNQEAARLLGWPVGSMSRDWPAPVPCSRSV